jgi:hypothetical protein
MFQPDLLSLSDAELEVVMSYAGPLPHQSLGAFLESVAAELSKLDHDLIGPGTITRVCRLVQRQYFDPPLDNRQHRSN